MAEIGEPDHVVRREREKPVTNPPVPQKPAEVPELEPA
jgi:hypothetical protein